MALIPGLHLESPKAPRSWRPIFFFPVPHPLSSLVPFPRLCPPSLPFLSLPAPCPLPRPFLALPSQNLERSGNQHKAEVEAIMEQLKELKQKGDRDKETLKKAIRAQKERAEKSEEYAEQLHVQLADKVTGLP